jgi:nitrogen fixation/metabolism regulation signal transduction histidine kinase
MIFNKYNFKIIVQVFIILVTCIILSWAITKNYLAVTYFTLSILLILEVVYLIYFLNKSNRSIAHFLNSIIYNDLTFQFDDEHEHQSTKELNKSFNIIIRKIEESLAEKEKTYQYLNHMIEQINVGLIAYNDSGTIDFMNSHAKNLIQIYQTKHINDLNQRNQLGQIIQNIQPSKSIILTLPIESELKKLLIKSSKIKSGENFITIVTIQDVKNELDEEEFKSWNKLIRVLTHEIMNSISPIISLTKSLIRINTNNEKDTKTKTLEGLQAIENRSSGLSDFVDSYKKLTKIPQPVFQTVQLESIFNQIENLFVETFKLKSIKFEKEVIPTNLFITADEKLIMQVIINVINNAVEEMKNRSKSKIRLSAFKNNKETIIQISDNGKGIEKEILEKIFVPFFTTKENGSGIGLSLTRQIILLHKGSIVVQSEIDKGTTFTLKF